jgi:hypothetical protein
MEIRAGGGEGAEVPRNVVTDRSDLRRAESVQIRHVVRVVVGRWLIVVVIFGVPLLLIRQQMRRPGRPVPESTRRIPRTAGKRT